MLGCEKCNTAELRIIQLLLAIRCISFALAYAYDASVGDWRIAYFSDYLLPESAPPNRATRMLWGREQQTRKDSLREDISYSKLPSGSVRNVYMVDLITHFLTDVGRKSKAGGLMALTKGCTPAVRHRTSRLGGHNFSLRPLNDFLIQLLNLPAENDPRL